MKYRPGPGSIATMASVVVLMGPIPALAQSANSSTAALEPQRSWQSSDAATIRQLQEGLEQRDAVIRDLLRRVQRLERQEAAHEATAPVAAGIKRGAAATKPPPVRTARSDPPTPQDPPTQQNPAPPPPQQGQPTATEPAKPQPGTFEVSEEAAQHALERALVQTGASLLPPGKLEFIPSATYQSEQNAHPAQIALATDGTVLITENVSRSRQIETAGLLRAGLPWNTQIEIGLPFEYKSLTTTSRVLGTGLGEQSTDVVGLGDLTLALTKQVLEEGDVRPGLFLSGVWNSNFGQTKKRVPLGTGFNEFSAGFTAVKRQDPLVFTAGFTYQTSLTHNNVTPGDQYTPAVGVLLAVSPETSLRFAQQVSFVKGIEVGGRGVPGSEQTSGLFTFGLLSILGRGLVMDFSASIGETPDAPDLSLRLAFPIRLN